MPRISRFVTEFSIPSQPDVIWQAEFQHQHLSKACPHTPEHVILKCYHRNSSGGVPHQVKDCPDPRGLLVCPSPRLIPVDYHIELEIGRYIKVQHVTTVKLRHKGSPIFMRGTAPCSLHDVYEWRKGLKLALQRACEKAGYVKLEKQDGLLRVVDSKPIYGEIMEAFHREMKIPPPEGRSTGGSNPRPLHEDTAHRATHRAASHGATGIVTDRVALLKAANTRHVLHGMGAVAEEGHVPAYNRMGLHYSGCD